MAHIAPDEDEDSHFLHVLTEGHDSDSSEGQIQSGQDLLQQAPSSPSGLMLPVPQADFTQASAIDQGCSFFTTSAQVRSEQDTSPPLLDALNVLRACIEVALWTTLPVL